MVVRGKILTGGHLTKDQVPTHTKELAKNDGQSINTFLKDPLCLRPFKSPPEWFKKISSFEPRALPVSIYLPRYHHPEITPIVRRNAIKPHARRRSVDETALARHTCTARNPAVTIANGRKVACVNKPRPKIAPKTPWRIILASLSDNFFNAMHAHAASRMTRLSFPNRAISGNHIGKTYGHSAGAN